jgi:hypothetical protein
MHPSPQYAVTRKRAQTQKTKEQAEETKVKGRAM